MEPQAIFRVKWDLGAVELFHNRRSVRAYLPGREIPVETLRELFGLVALSPSSYNLQPWEFVVVKGGEGKERLFSCSKGNSHILSSSATAIALGKLDATDDSKKIFDDRIAKGQKTESDRPAYEKAIARISSSNENARLWATRSTSLAAMTLMYAATALGLATCPIEGFDEECVREKFGIPANREIVMLVTLGYEDGSKATTRGYRKPVEQIVHFEKF